MSGAGELAEADRSYGADAPQAGDSWTILRMILWSA